MRTRVLRMGRSGRIGGFYPPFNRDVIRGRAERSFLSHASGKNGTVSANRLTLQEPDTPPKYLPLADAIAFVDALRPHTLRLMGYLALLCGMRREEITGLSRHVVPNPCGCDTSKSIPMILDARKTPTKGMKTRTVMVPYGLAAALWNYFCEHWPNLNAIYRSTHCNDSELFFLSAYGRPLSVRYLNNSFKKASDKIKITCTPHLLRHTFGTYELLRVSRQMGDSKALLWVRDRMGHSSVSTTELYIHTADLIRHAKVDGYQTEILRALTNGNPT